MTVRVLMTGFMFMTVLMSMFVTHARGRVGHAHVRQRDHAYVRVCVLRSWLHLPSNEIRLIFACLHSQIRRRQARNIPTDLKSFTRQIIL